MYKILKAEKLAEKIFLMDVEAPRVAKHCEPGWMIWAKEFHLLFVIMTEKQEL